MLLLPGNPLTANGLCLELRPSSHPDRVLNGAGQLPGGDTPPTPFQEEEQMKVRPLYDRILVRRVAEEEKTKGGIIIPDSAKEKPSEGEVVAVGSGKVNEKGELRALEVKKGDRILFGKYSGNEIKVDGDELIILREDEVLGVIEK